MLMVMKNMKIKLTDTFINTNLDRSSKTFAQLSSESTRNRNVANTDFPGLNILGVIVISKSFSERFKTPPEAAGAEAIASG